MIHKNASYVMYVGLEIGVHHSSDIGLAIPRNQVALQRARGSEIVMVRHLWQGRFRILQQGTCGFESFLVRDSRNRIDHDHQLASELRCRRHLAKVRGASQDAQGSSQGRRLKRAVPIQIAARWHAGSRQADSIMFGLEISECFNRGHPMV